MNISRTFLAAPAVGIAALLLTGAPALASSSDTGSVMGELTPVPLNDAPGSGEATIEVDGTTVSFTLAYDGLLAGGVDTGQAAVGGTDLAVAGGGAAALLAGGALLVARRRTTTDS